MRVNPVPPNVIALNLSGNSTPAISLAKSVAGTVFLVGPPPVAEEATAKS